MPSISRRRFAALGAVLGVSALGLPTVLPVRRAQAQSNQLNLYTGRHYDTDDQLYGGFMALTGIQVNVLRGDADQLIERIRSEGANSPADVLLTVDAGRLWRAQQAGLLRPVQSETLTSRVPANMREPEGYWYGFSTRARIIAYSTERVDPSQLPTYESVADPRWRGRVVARSSSHVYNQSLVGSMIAASGMPATEQWARGVAANFARTPQGGDTDQLLAVASGEADVALSNHYYWARLANSPDPAERDAAARVGVIFPNQGDRGTHVNLSGGGLVATAPNPDAGVAFLEYLTSEFAQAHLAFGNFEWPVVPGVILHPTLESLGSYWIDPLNARVYGENGPLALLLMQRAGWR